MAVAALKVEIVSMYVFSCSHTYFSMHGDCKHELCVSYYWTCFFLCVSCERPFWEVILNICSVIQTWLDKAGSYMMKLSLSEVVEVVMYWAMLYIKAFKYIYKQLQWLFKATFNAKAVTLYAKFIIETFYLLLVFWRHSQILQKSLNEGNVSVAFCLCFQ